MAVIIINSCRADFFGAVCLIFICIIEKAGFWNDFNDRKRFPMADIVFMGLHGDIGENGKLQAAFDVLGIKYTGPNSLGSALAMDKGITKQIFQKNGVLILSAIPRPASARVKTSSSLSASYGRPMKTSSRYA